LATLHSRIQPEAQQVISGKAIFMATVHGKRRDKKTIPGSFRKNTVALPEISSKPARDKAPLHYGQT